jgi:hypothetical protein
MYQLQIKQIKIPVFCSLLISKVAVISIPVHVQGFKYIYDYKVLFNGREEM